MCGIVAAYAYGGAAPKVNPQELRRVRDHMAARGPDGAGEWFSPDGRVGLGHRRLAIIDLSAAAAQPMMHGQGRLVISFNGEIYNYKELRASLTAAGHVFTSSSDTEVLLHLYEQHGVGMLAMLRGMFAFALWDAEKGAMLLARDPFGIKPLYYGDRRGTVRAASQVRALLQADVDTTPDPAGNAGFFLWGSVPEPWTLYKGIRSVPAGHYVWVMPGTGASAPAAYWRLGDVLSDALSQPARGSRGEALEAIAAALQDSIRAHRVADVPVGLFLSGGIDSGMLACSMAASGDSPHAVTLGFPEYEGHAADERALASRLATQLGLKHDVLVTTRSEFEHERSRLLAAMDQPSLDGVNTWFIAHAAAARGMKVAISGLGGDELFASYPSFRQVPLLHKWMRWPARVPALGGCIRRIADPLLRPWTSPKYAGVLEHGGTLGGAYLLRRGLFMPWELPRVMDADMAREGWQELDEVGNLNRHAVLPAGPAADRLRVSALEMGRYMRNQLLRDADWAGMAHSLEIRVPFVDAQLLGRVAPWIAAHPDIDKTSVARAAAPQLQRDWLQRPKSGFQVPVREWLGARGNSSRGLRPWARLVHDALSRATPQGRPRVLVSTLAPGQGGVNAMTTLAVDVLARHGLEPVIAHYAPYSIRPTLSVPSYRLLQRRIGRQTGVGYGGHQLHAIGAWLPELEFTHYLATRSWRELIRTCHAHLAVSGNILAATPYWQSGRPYLAWVATDWDGDRRDRARTFPAARRVLDRMLNGPVIRQLERRLLRAGQVLPLSEYTDRMLTRAARQAPSGPIVPMCVDTDLLVPRNELTVPGRIGFVGRFSDPRKNVGLLYSAITELRRRGLPATGILIGDRPPSAQIVRVRALGIEDHVVFAGPLSRADLVNALQALDVFVVPSHQEGLCIAALEAMSCGVPVVSTRCGGPEEFVLPGETGELCEPQPEALADRIWEIVSDRPRREQLARNARRLVEDRYSRRRVEDVFWRSFSSTFPDLAASAASS